MFKTVATHALVYAYCSCFVLAYSSRCMLHAGDTGLEIAPGIATENAEALIADPGNIWSGVPEVDIIMTLAS